MVGGSQLSGVRIFMITLKRLATFFKTALIIFVVLSTASCLKQEETSYNLEKNVGLYEVVKHDCRVQKGEFNPCDETRFVELVKGNFYGIKDSELALVFWSGLKADTEMTYTAQKLIDHKTLHRTTDKVWLTNGDAEREYFLLNDETVVEYHLEVLKKTASGKINKRTIVYRLKPTNRSKHPELKLDYPGNT